MNGSLRRFIPNLITLTGLVCAFSAVVLAVHDELALSGACIITGYVLDAADGEAARRLGVSSAFGLQLDSLVDAVTFGVAPGLLVYQHLRDLGFLPLAAWTVCAGYLIGGVLRLARCNLLPAKTTHSEIVGLTISTSGATLALSVLANLAYGHRLLPTIFFAILAALLMLLMVSHIRYPALASLFRRRGISGAILGTAALLAVPLSPQLVGLALTGGYVSFGLIRAIYERT
jgi:CDP-diacylglycerol--serine O-phosphatidyltransferase